MGLFNHAGTIRVTLPGSLQEPPPKGDHRLTRQKTMEEFSYPRLSHTQCAKKRIRLLSGRVVRVSQANNLEFYEWYLDRLRAASANGSAYTLNRQTILSDVDLTHLDMHTRWYLLEELMHMASYKYSGVKLFMDDEAGVA